MIKLGLIGRNISYSKSPQLHRAIGRFLDCDIEYDLIDIEESEIPIYISKLRSGEYQGFNVTKPYKQKMIKYIDQLSPIAKKIQAVNTIYIKEQEVIGDNTDYEGFLGTLLREKIDVKHKKVCILGSGGAAKACYHVLKDLDADVIIASRRKSTIDQMFDKVISYDEIKYNQIDLYVQATPIGTYPNTNESILPKEFVSEHTVIDLIYNPPMTKILKESKKGINGVQMMVIQAIKSEEIWLNKKIKLTEKLIHTLKEVITDE